MAEALGHPRLGYYRRARPLGAAGDFTTAPEISQMFGELIGAWLAERWLAMGRPSPVALVELGPGRGTLMADALRATRGVPGFHAALDFISSRPTRRCAPSSSARSRRSSRPGTSASTRCRPGRCCWSPTNSSTPCRCASSRRPRAAGASAWSASAPDGETLVFALAPGATPFARFLPDAADGAEAEISEPAARSPPRSARA